MIMSGVNFTASGSLRSILTQVPSSSSPLTLHIIILLGECPRNDFQKMDKHGIGGDKRILNQDWNPQRVYIPIQADLLKITFARIDPTYGSPNRLSGSWHTDRKLVSSIFHC